MDEAVYSRGRRQRVLEEAFPFRKDEVAGKQLAFSKSGTTGPCEIRNARGLGSLDVSFPVKATVVK